VRFIGTGVSDSAKFFAVIVVIGFDVHFLKGVLGQVRKGGDLCFERFRPCEFESVADESDRFFSRTAGVSLTVNGLPFAVLVIVMEIAVVAFAAFAWTGLADDGGNAFGVSHMLRVALLVVGVHEERRRRVVITIAQKFCELVGIWSEVALI